MKHDSELFREFFVSKFKQLFNRKLKYDTGDKTYRYKTNK